eukprot:359866-Chlamydomonas_euryale.AAC.1
MGSAPRPPNRWRGSRGTARDAAWRRSVVSAGGGAATRSTPHAAWLGHAGTGHAGSWSTVSALRDCGLLRGRDTAMRVGAAAGSMHASAWDEPARSRAHAMAEPQRRGVTTGCMTVWQPPSPQRHQLCAFQAMPARRGVECAAHGAGGDGVQEDDGSVLDLDSILADREQVGRVNCAARALLGRAGSGQHLGRQGAGGAGELRCQYNLELAACTASMMLSIWYVR